MRTCSLAMFILLIHKGNFTIKYLLKQQKINKKKFIKTTGN